MTFLSTVFRGNQEHKAGWVHLAHQAGSSQDPRYPFPANSTFQSLDSITGWSRTKILFFPNEDTSVEGLIKTLFTYSRVMLAQLGFPVQ